MRLAVVIPVYNERPTLAPLLDGVAAQTAAYETTIFCVDDGSRDGSWEELCALQARHANLRLIRFRRNRGKTHALGAGFHQAAADVVVMMDSDLQDDPAEIPRLLAALDEGYDLVTGRKADRRDPWHKTLPSAIFNRWVGYLFGMELRDVNSGFKAMRHEVAVRLPLFADMHRLLPVWAHYIGYRVGEIDVRHHPRRHGRSSYGISRFFHGARDVLLARRLMRCRRRPGRLFIAPVLTWGVLALVALALLVAGLIRMDAAPATAAEAALPVWSWLPAVALVLIAPAYVLLTLAMAFDYLTARQELPPQAAFVAEERLEGVEADATGDRGTAR